MNTWQRMASESTSATMVVDCQNYSSTANDHGERGSRNSGQRMFRSTAAPKARHSRIRYLAAMASARKVRRSFITRFIPLLLVITPLVARAQAARFAIWSDDEQVGIISVDRTFSGDTTFYSMRSISTVDVVFWTQVVRTAVRAEYVAGRLQACGSTVHVNDVMRDSSSMHVRQGVTHSYVHPDTMHRACDNAWTTARMYYEEPVGRKSIYVESLLGDFPLESGSPGIYHLRLPENKVNRYVYRNGVLQEVQVDRPFIALVFRRA